MIDQAQSLRIRQIKATNNPVIRDALEQERAAIANAGNTLQEVK
jgi:hypothetical protein